MVVALLLMLGATTASGIMLTVSGHWLKEVHELAANVTIVSSGSPGRCHFRLRRTSRRISFVR